MTRATILYAEDHAAVRTAVAETLELEGWRVESCADGRAALALLESDARLDLILLDNDLPGVGGLELLRRARTLAHRRATPAVMLSADDCAAEARRAGADAFLLKPDGVARVAAVVARLLEARAGG